MDQERFDKLARSFAGGSNRRGFLKRIAGLAAGAAAVTLPSRAGATGTQCYSDSDCSSYNYEVCGYDGYCECAEGYKDCNGTCIDEYLCCGDYDCGDYETCDTYGACVCAEGYKDCNGTCIDEYLCCGDYDCADYETCDTYGACVCAEGYKDCNGTCIDEYLCCGDYDCGDYETCDTYGACVCADGYKQCGDVCIDQYACCTNDDCNSYKGEICDEYGACVVPEKPVEPEEPIEPTEPEEEDENGTTPPKKKYGKKLDRICNSKCIKGGRQSAKRKKTRLTSTRMKRIRNTCKRRCTKKVAR